MDNVNTTILRVLGLIIGVCLLTGSSLAQSEQDSNKTMVLTERLDRSNISQDANPSITIALDKVPLKEALKRIAGQVEAGLYYNAALLPEKTVSLRLKAVPLGKALRNVLEGTSLKVITSGRNISLRPQKKTSSTPLPLISIQEMITGTVTDAQSGETLPGVNILVKGTSTGASTDANGAFELTVESLQDTLVVSYIGYKTKEVPINGRAEIDIKLASQAIAGEEMVVVGYGTTGYQDLTGSIATINQERIKDIPVTTSIDQNMIGQVAGVEINQATGKPGGGTSVRIRGLGSLGAGNEPLYVIDGFSYSSGMNQQLNPLAFINPSDIESISVLKGASATAIYGSRGSNGVILINTQKGSYNQTEINVSSSAGISRVPQGVRPNMMNQRQFARYQQDKINKAVRTLENRDATQNDYPEAYRYPEQMEGYGTNWYDLIMRPALEQRHSISLNHGSDNSRMYFNLGYLEQEGVIKYTGLDRYNVTLNFETNISEALKIGGKIQSTYIEQDQAMTDSHRHDILSTSLWLNPVPSAYDENGELKPFIKSPGNQYSKPWDSYNPLFALREITQTEKIFQTLGKTFIEWTIIDNLEFRTSLDLKWSNSNYFSFRPSTVPSLPWGATNPPVEGTGEGNVNRGRTINWLIENTLKFNKSIKNHSINGILGYTTQKSTSDNVGLNGFPFPNDLIRTINAAQDINSWTQNVNEWSMISYLGRIKYGFKDRYLLTATFRLDGSSRFGEKKRYAFFPSAAVAWRLSEEGFLRNSQIINDLKLRVGYGQSGNNNIGNYTHIASINTGSYVFENEQVAASQVGLYNPYLTWEESSELDIGLDFALFNNRLSFTADYYNRKSIGMLLQNRIPAITGFGSQTVNMGSVRNRGFEFSLNGTPVSTGQFNWNSKLNIALNRNKVLSTNENNERILTGNLWGFPSHITKVGEPAAQFFGFKWNGLLTPEDMQNPDVAKAPFSHVGGNQYKDINGDGRITDIQDYTIIGNPFPDFTFGLTNSFSYKNLNLSIILNGQYGGKVVNQIRAETDFLWGNMNLREEWVNRWISPENSGDGIHQGVTPTGADWSWKLNSLWVEDATYLRITNIKLGYTLPQRWISNLNLDNCQLYLNVRNLKTFTNYRGSNPDAQRSGGGRLTPGWDWQSYPLARSFSLGINLSF